MKAGRQKIKPDFLRVVDGNRGHRAGGKKSSRTPKGRPTPPPIHLTEHAKLAWKTWEPVLREMGVFRSDYAVSLERACELYADILALQKEIADQGRFYKTTNKAGDVMIRPHPAAGQLADADRRLASYLSEFGLTPSGRARLLSAKGKDDDSGTGQTDEDAFFG